MSMEVRSDFTIALELRTPDGKRHRLGKFHHEHLEEEVYEMEGEKRMEAVPHLLRAHPSAPVVAALDPDHNRITLVTLDEAGNVAERSELQLEGIDGRARQFRWLSSTPGISVATEDEVYLVPFDVEDAPNKATGTPILAPLPFAGSTRIVDTRALPSGLMVRADRMDDQGGWWQGQVFHVGLADGAVQQVDALVGPQSVVMGANVAADGGIAVVTENYGDEPAEGAALTPDNTAGIWVFAAPEPGEAPRPAHRLDCPDDSCWGITNWSPGAPLLTFATDGEVHMRSLDGQTEHRWSPEFDADDDYAVDTLWVNDAGDKVVSATATRLSVWSLGATEEQLMWRAPKGTTIQGAHFDLDDQTLIVAAGKKVYRLDEQGQPTRIASAKGKYRAPRAEDWGEGKSSFVDQAVPLPGGGIALGIVDLEQTWESADEHWDEEMMEAEWDAPPAPSALAPAPGAPAEVDLVDPFSKRD